MIASLFWHRGDIDSFLFQVIPKSDVQQLTRSLHNRPDMRNVIGEHPTGLVLMEAGVKDTVFHTDTRASSDENASHPVHTLSEGSLIPSGDNVGCFYITPALSFPVKI